MCSHICWPLPDREPGAGKQEGDKLEEKNGWGEAFKPVAWVVGAQVESRPIQASLVTVIAKLDKLVRLKLSAGPAADKCQGTRSPGLHVLAGCTSLEQLILKDALIREEEVCPFETNYPPSIRTCHSCQISLGFRSGQLGIGGPATAWRVKRRHFLGMLWLPVGLFGVS